LLSAHLEIGEIDVDQNWKWVGLHKPFVDPIVIAKAFSDHQGKPAIVQVRGVEPTGFEISLRSWDHAGQAPGREMVGFLVIERGRFSLADGTTLESGTVDINPAYPVHSLAFSPPFPAAPVVMTTVTNTMHSGVVIGQPSQVSSKGFQLRMQQQVQPQPVETLQTIAYIAWQPSTGTLDGLAFEVSRTQAVTRGQLSTLPFTDIFATTPVFLADLQSSGGGSPLNVRWEHKDLAGVDVKIDVAESLIGDEVQPQDGDVVGYILIR
jgi:hypothetical protein